MVIWSGRGFLIALIAIGCLAFTELMTRAAWDSSYYAAHGWPKFVAFASAAGIIAVLAGVGSEPGPIFRPRDSLFFLPAKFWPLVLCALALVCAFVK